MSEPFYENAGSLLSPGDLFDSLPYIRVPKPIKVARKPAHTLPKGFQGRVGEIRELFEVGKDRPNPPFKFEAPGEEILVTAKLARAVFLTWGSEVEDDQRRGSLHKKDWLIAPAFPIAELKSIKAPGTEIMMADIIRGGSSPRFFPLAAHPTTGEELYVDFRKICPLSANSFDGVQREWRLAGRALNDFYHHLIWFLTRKHIFFEPIRCGACGAEVDLGLVFEGQPVEPETESE